MQETEKQLFISARCSRLRATLRQITRLLTRTAVRVVIILLFAWPLHSLPRCWVSTGQITNPEWDGYDDGPLWHIAWGKGFWGPRRRYYSPARWIRFGGRVFLCVTEDDLRTFRGYPLPAPKADGKAR